jgi:hypothetical protein
MSYKSMLVALLGLSLTGCAVYGGSGYGHRGYDRHYSTTYYHAQPYPVYVVPRHHPHGVRSGDHRQDKHHQAHYYAPAPLSPRYHRQHHDVRQAYVIKPHAGWDKRHVRAIEQRREHRYDSRRGDERRGWAQRY